MNSKINRLNKMMPTYHILKRIKKPEILTKQFSLIKKIKVIKDLTKLGIIKPKHRRKSRKKKEA